MKIISLKPGLSETTKKINQVVDCHLDSFTRIKNYENNALKKV